MNQNSKTWVIVIIVIVVVALGIWWFMENQSEGTISSSNTQTNTTATATPDVQASLSYNNALKLYGENRIQFDQNCVVTPNEVTFKTGTAIMLDNRSNKNRVISLDNVDYNISAYNFTVVALHTNAALPHTISVDCGKGENQGRIVLQK